MFWSPCAVSCRLGNERSPAMLSQADTSGPVQLLQQSFRSAASLL